MKTTICRLLGLVALFGIGGANCDYRQTQDATSQDETSLFGNYRVTFDASSKKLDLFGQLRTKGPDGESIRLNGDSKMTSMIGNSVIEFQAFDGDKNLANLGGTYYSSSVDGVEPEQDYVFAWTRTNGVVFENTVHLGAPLVIVAPLADATHQSGTDLVVTFSPAVGANEEVSCSININNTLVKERTTAKEGAKSCTFSGTFLVGAFDWKSTIELSRKMTLNRPQSGHDIMGGVLESIFIAKPVSIRIIN